MGQFPNKATQFKPGNPGGGRPKGTRNWSGIVQALLADKDLAKKVINKDSELFKRFPNRNLAEYIAMAMCVRAASGDVVAAEWVRRTGYGNTGKYIPEPEIEPAFSAKPRLKVIMPMEIRKEFATGP